MKKLSTKWNAADTTLLCAAFVFLASLGFHILNPNSIIAEGILFVAEAALVGGVADWFAVTALFKKPLGFPFHTAILPNRRQDFVDASVNMVQNEFFSRRSIFTKVSNLHLLPKLVAYMKRSDIRASAIKILFKQLVEFISKLDKESSAKKIANEIRRTLRDVPPNILIHEVSQWIKRSEKDKQFFVYAIKSLREIAETPETRQKIQSVLESYAGEKTQASFSFSSLMTNLAQSLDLVNFEEAAKLTQQYLIKFLNELTIDSQLQQDVLNQCHVVFAEVVDTIEFRDLIYSIQIDSINALPLDSIIYDALVTIDNQLSNANLDKLTEKSNDKKLPNTLFKFLATEYDRLLKSLETDSDLKNSIKQFIFDLTARTALHARPLFANIAQTSLLKLTDEQLNSLVYNKAEQDFIWIRLNGSIVGSILGLVIFIITHIGD